MKNIRLLILFNLISFSNINYSQITIEKIGYKSFKFEAYPNDVIELFDSRFHEVLTVKDSVVNIEKMLWLIDTIDVVPLTTFTDEYKNNERFALLLEFAEQDLKYDDISLDLSISDFFKLPASFSKGKFYNQKFNTPNEALILFENSKIKDNCKIKSLRIKSKQTKIPGLLNCNLYCDKRKIFSFYLLGTQSYQPFKNLLE